MGIPLDRQAGASRDETVLHGRRRGLPLVVPSSQPAGTLTTSTRIGWTRRATAQPNDSAVSPVPPATAITAVSRPSREPSTATVRVGFGEAAATTCWTSSANNHRPCCLTPSPRRPSTNSSPSRTKPASPVRIRAARCGAVDPELSCTSAVSGRATSPVKLAPASSPLTMSVQPACSTERTVIRALPGAVNAVRACTSRCRRRPGGPARTARRRRAGRQVVPEGERVGTGLGCPDC